MLEKHDRKPIREIGLFSGERHGGSPIVVLKSVTSAKERLIIHKLVLQQAQLIIKNIMNYEYI